MILLELWLRGSLLYRDEQNMGETKKIQEDKNSEQSVGSNQKVRNEILQIHNEARKLGEFNTHKVDWKQRRQQLAYIAGLSKWLAEQIPWRQRGGGGKGQESFRDILSNKRQEIHDHALPEIIWHIDIRSIDR